MRPYITDDLAGFADATIHFYRGISPLGTKAAARAPARGSRSHHWGLVLAFESGRGELRLTVEPSSSR